MFTQKQIEAIKKQIDTWYELSCIEENENDRELFNEYLQDVADACDMAF